MSRSSFFALLLVLSSPFVAMPSQAQTYACFETNMGPGQEFCMEFLRDDAPNTVNNFINYVNKPAYNNTFVHLSIPSIGFQGGRYYYEPTLGAEVAKDAPVANEFKTSNTRGTVAMYITDGAPDGATSEWVVNLADNSSTLDAEKYTVFAKIVKGMKLVDAIGGLGLVNLSESLGDEFDSVPVLRKDSDGVGLEDLVQIKRVYLTDTVEKDPDPAVEAEKLFQCTANWVKEVFPQEVCMETNMGNFCMDMMHDQAYQTVANFLHYVADGDYNNTFIHRSVPDFVVQGGGIKTQPLLSAVPTDPSVVNEYSTPNTRGTVALAKQDGLPDSGNSQWFVNVADNSDTLGPNNNGGFSVFAKVHDADMNVVDSIAALTRLDMSSLNSIFTEVPMRNIDYSRPLSLGDFVVVKRAYIPGHEINPCVAKPGALTELVDRTFTVPVRLTSGVIMEFLFTQQYVEGAPVFRPAMWRIRTLKDVGQETATFDAATKLLSIPSVYVPDAPKQVFYNVQLRLIPGSQDLDFILESFDPPPAEAEILIPTTP